MCAGYDARDVTVNSTDSPCKIKEKLLESNN